MRKRLRTAAYSGAPVVAWADVLSDPVKAHRLKSERGKGGLVHVTSYVIGLWLPSAITASILLLTMTGVCRTAHRRDEEMSIS